MEYFSSKLESYEGVIAAKEDEVADLRETAAMMEEENRVGALWHAWGLMAGRSL